MKSPPEYHRRRDKCLSATLCVLRCTFSDCIHVNASGFSLDYTAQGCGATVCRTQQSLDPNRTFHCDGNDVWSQILGALFDSVGSHPGIWLQILFFISLY